jgi:hypothetical protein
MKAQQVIAKPPARSLLLICANLRKSAAKGLIC